MQPSQKLTLIGGSISIVTIVLGIVALSTRSWIVLTDPVKPEVTYSLFSRCTRVLGTETTTPSCLTLNGFQTAQSLVIIGFAMTAIGIIISVLAGVCLDNYWFKLIPQVLIIAGSTSILIGILIYVKNVLGIFTAGAIKLNLGYSFILILITCVVGYISAAYLIYVAGFAHGCLHQRTAVLPVSR